MWLQVQAISARVIEPRAKQHARFAGGWRCRSPSPTVASKSQEGERGERGRLESAGSSYFYFSTFRSNSSSSSTSTFISSPHTIPNNQTLLVTDLVRVEAQDLGVSNADHAEGLVELVELDIMKCEAGMRQSLRHRETRRRREPLGRWTKRKQR